MALPKGVQKVVKHRKDGTEAVFYYWRSPRQKLPDPTNPDFLPAIERAKLVRQAPHEAGTFGALVIEYKRSPNYRNLQIPTQKSYDRDLERLRSLNSQPVTDIRRPDILALRDSLALATPQAANHLVMVLGVLMQFAVEREWRETNPCSRIGRIRGGHHKRWADEQIQYALTHFKERFRRAVILGLYTGQREGDCCAMAWRQYDGTAIEVVPEKSQRWSEKTLWIPVHRALKKELDAWKREATCDHILTSSLGKAWNKRSFATVFCELVAEHPKLDGLVFHGLRKSAAARLAEAGCPTLEIAAITGHDTLDMIELYTKQADQRRRATSAMRRLELVSDNFVTGPKHRK